MKPLFIVIDGIDGSGKSVQTKLLTEWLCQRGVYAESTREPGGTAAGESIRSILINKNMELEPETELFLFCADRAEHQRKIRSLLAKGVSVICDRFLPSTWAYQVFGRKLQPVLLKAIIPHTVHMFPDLTFILDMDVDLALKRAKERLEKEKKGITEGRFEAEDREFFYDVQRGFRWYASQKQFGKSLIIDAGGAVEEVSKRVRKACMESLNI